MKNKFIVMSTAVVLSSGILSANDISVSKFLGNALKSNPAFKNLSIKVVDTEKIKGLKNWKAYNIEVSGSVSNNGKMQKIHESSTYFSNGRFLSSNMTDMTTGEKITIEPKFLKSYYHHENLISGSSKSKHKIAIFSDPMCPFCKRDVPKILRFAKRHPSDIAVYYYDLPLSIHPASSTITRINTFIRDKSKNKIDDVLSMYDLEIEPSETNQKVLLKDYNKQLGTNVKISSIKLKNVENEIKRDSTIAEKLSVNGTPTVFIDGKISNDRSVSSLERLLSH